MSPTAAVIAYRTWAIPHPDKHPTAIPTTIVAEIQTEDDTCGLHALSSLYRSYELDPVEEQLRRRIGIDVEALVWMPSSTGALQPDIFMVLSQDYFQVQSESPQDAMAWQGLTEHLDRGHPALLLVRRRQTGGLHWVVAANRTGEQIQIIDSLDPEIVMESRNYLNEQVISILLVQPARDQQARSSVWALTAGAIALVSGATRM